MMMMMKLMLVRQEEMKLLCKKRQNKVKHTVKIPGLALDKTPGRPKNYIVSDSSQQTIVSMFKPVVVSNEFVKPDSVNI